MENRVLWLVCNSSPLPLLTPHTLNPAPAWVLSTGCGPPGKTCASTQSPQAAASLRTPTCSSVGSSTSCIVDICSDMVLLWPARKYSMCCRVISTLVSEALPSFLFSDLGISRTAYYTFPSLTPHCHVVFLSFLNTLWQRCHLFVCWADLSPAVGLLEQAWTDQKQLCLAWGRPGLCSQRALCGPSPVGPCPKPGCGHMI